MTLDVLIMISGAFVALLPFLGFPNTWDAVLFLIAGIVIIALGIIVRRRSGAPMSTHYIENSPRSEVHEEA